MIPRCVEIVLYYYRMETYNKNLWMILRICIKSTMLWTVLYVECCQTTLGIIFSIHPDERMRLRHFVRINKTLRTLSKSVKRSNAHYSLIIRDISSLAIVEVKEILSSSWNHLATNHMRVVVLVIWSRFHLSSSIPDSLGHRRLGRNPFATADDFRSIG